MRFENSAESSAKSAPFSNCRYPIGVSVAGVEYRGSSRISLWYGWNPGLCLAELSKGALNMQSKQIGTIFNLSPLNRTRKSISETNAARTSACMLLFRQNARARGQQDVQSREFRYGPERSVRRGQCVVSPAELGRNPRKHMNAE
jgi:hypothetical protein